MKEIRLNIRKKYFFKYIVIDDFFSNNDFEYFTKEFNTIETYPSDQLREISWLRVFNDNEIEKKIDGDYLTEEKVLEIKKNYYPMFYQILSEVSPLKKTLIDYIDFELVVCGSKYRYEIHDDVPYKLLSIVIYLMPEESIGTILYPCPTYRVFDGSFRVPQEGTCIQWKQNRALIFPRIGQKTWHSYQGNGKQNRLAFVINVCTKQIEKVQEIEKSNEFKNSVTWVT